jgi:uncharacterized SAM-dependent methyltransferase
MNIGNNIILKDRRKKVRPDFKRDFERSLMMYSDAHLAPYLYEASDEDDIRGAELWEWTLQNIPEYYLKSAEVEILNSPKVLKEISSIIGKGAAIIELGPGSTVLEKTIPLMKTIKDLKGYVGVDIAKHYSISSASTVRKVLPNIKSVGIYGNFLDKRLIRYVSKIDKPVLFCVGNIVGNVAEENTREWPMNTILEMRRFREITEKRGYMIISQDITQDKNVLYKAYFHKGFQQTTCNILNRVRSDAGVELDKSKFKFQVFITRKNDYQCCVINQLLATEEQEIMLDNIPYRIKKGDTIDVNRSYKFSADYFRKMAEEAGWKQEAVFFDKDERMALHVFKA